MKFTLCTQLVNRSLLAIALLGGGIFIPTSEHSFFDTLVYSADEISSEEQPNYCANFEAFAERFVRPEFPQDAPEDVQRSWYALKKTCGRDLIKLSLAQWPTFAAMPKDADSVAWEKFIAAAELSRFNIGEAIFDENHGGTLIKKYYFTDYEPDKIIALYNKSLQEIAAVESIFDELTQDEEWKAARRAEFDVFFADFERWFAPYCRASLDKIPPIEEFVSEPDYFLTTANLLEFAVDYIPSDEKFISTLNGIVELLKAPKAVEIRVFHGRYEGFNLVSRDEIFQRYCTRIENIVKRQAEESLKPRLVEAQVFNGRQTELFSHGSLSKWGAKNPNQEDQFYIVFPKQGPVENSPLYVVLHSAGHSAKTALDCTLTEGNHDIYTVPEDFYGIYVDCFNNKETDWWWGGRQANEPEINAENAAKATAELQPVEKRVFDEIAWAIKTYKIDPERVYLCGNSMGGSGTLGLGIRHGDVFAAIKANVPAGVWHAYDRLQLGEASAPTGMSDPPVCLDYSAPNDDWSAYHEVLFEGMEARKYSYIAYWGNFGHENNDKKVAKHNDLFKTFDWTSIRKDEAYPVFTNASTDSKIPWPAREADAPAGQRGAYFRWENRLDSPEKFEIELRLATAEELNSQIFEIPTSANADLTLRRLQNFEIAPNEIIKWSMGDKSGVVEVDNAGLITIPSLTITDKPAVLVLEK